MHKRITFKGMEHSAPMEQEANKQLEKVEKFLLEEDRTPIYIDLVLEPSRVHSHHKIELRVKSPQYDRISNYEGPEFYLVLSRVIDVMYRELHEDKKRLDENKRMVGRHDEFKKER